MTSQLKYLVFICIVVIMSSCVSKKQYSAMQSDLKNAQAELANYDQKIKNTAKRLSDCEQEKLKLQGELNTSNNSLKIREEQIMGLKGEVTDAKEIRDKQLSQVGDLTVLSKTANDNIKETLSQLEGKDRYIRHLQNAKTKADSMNLALAFNLKSVLKEGIDDKDVEIKVDKTVVFVNLSDKMLYQSGSANLTPRANEVLGKIAKIVESRPEFEVMVEGYTDNVPIKNSCMTDNWDLSVKRATSVVRVLQDTYNIDPNRLIAAGRGEYNTLADNNTSAGRSVNRRTRIIILPKLNQFYDLLNPNNVPN
ncbi:MAG: OmpA family protein [Chitinophagales bacterium]